MTINTITNNRIEERELALSGFCAANPMVKEKARQMLHRITSILQANSVFHMKPDNGIPYLNELKMRIHPAQVLGSTDLTIAGAIGLNPITINQLSKKGSVRECFTAAYNSLRTLSVILESESNVQAINQHLEEFQIDPNKIRQYKEERGHLFSLRSEGAAHRSSDFGSVRSRRKNPHEIPSLTVRSLKTSAPLSSREKRVLKTETLHSALPWKTGEQTWELEEAHPFVQQVKAIGMRMIAGPSGTTDRLFELASLLHLTDTKIDQQIFRLACIAYLIPIRAHSLHEVMLGAAPYQLADEPTKNR